MTTKAPSGWAASSSQLIKLTLKTVLHRYRNLHVYGKVRFHSLTFCSS